MTTNEWFPTKEKTPNHPGFVIMAQENDGALKSFVGCYEYGDWYFMNEEEAGNIVLWCEIPQPPKQ